MSTEPKRPDLVAPTGRPVRDEACPICRVAKSKRVPSGGFGNEIHDVCGNCGHDFEEYTCG